MLLRDGGIQNYLLEFVLALILLAITGISWDKIQTMRAKLFYPLLLGVIFFSVLWSYTSFPWETKIYITERLNVFNKEKAIMRDAASILVEDPLVAYAVDAPVELDPYTFGQIVDSGNLSTTKLFYDIKNGKYAFIDDYGAFDRIPGLMDITNNTFQPVLVLTFSKPIKPFDYSLYNRNTYKGIGTLYRYSSAKNTIQGL